VTDNSLKRKPAAIKAPAKKKAPQKPSAPPPKARPPASPYEVHDERFTKWTRDGFAPICNFKAQIVEQHLVDDGVEAHREFIIEGTLATGEKLERISVPASKFYHPAEWVLPGWGARAIIHPKAEHDVRAAIQFVSQKVKSAVVLAHTGWREVNGKLGYITASGAIGADLDVTVRLPGTLGRYALPAKPTQPRVLIEAVRAALRIVDVAPHRVTLPALAAVFRSVTMHWLKVDVAVWLFGRSGSFKSTLAALLLGFWTGTADRMNLLNWSATANAIEDALFRAKDAIVVVDNFAPRQGDEHDAHRRNAPRVIHAIGDGGSRARLGKDMRPMAERPPRGFAVITAEDLPSGESTNARLFAIGLRRDDVDVAVLSEVQADADKLPIAMRGYIEYVAKRAAEDDFAGVLRRQFETLRVEFTGGESTMHMRAPAAAADLGLGLCMFLSFAESIGAIDEATQDDLWSRFKVAAGEQLKVHTEATRGEDPVQQWLSCLASLLAAGRVELLPAWNKPTEFQTKVIGWRRADGRVQLLGDVVFPIVVEAMNKAGKHMPLKYRTFWKELADRELLVRDQGRLQTRPTSVAGDRGDRPWVYELTAGALRVEAQYEVSPPGEVSPPQPHVKAAGTASVAQLAQFRRHHTQRP